MTSDMMPRSLPGPLHLLALLLGTQAFIFNPRPAQRSRRVATSTNASPASTNPPVTRPDHPDVDISKVPVWEVPPHIRRSDAPPCGPQDYVRFVGLEEVFGGADGRSLAEKFDSDASFRRDIRVAMRDDLFIPDPKRSDKVNRFLKDLMSSLHVSWTSSPTGYHHLSSVFQSAGLSSISGEGFIKTLGGLAGGGAIIEEQGFPLHEKRFGSLIDIVNIGRLKVAHSWHQDSGLEAMTVMLGFPKENHYSGTGVFSHGVKLSHRLKDQVPGGGQVIQYDEYPDVLPTLPESCIIRPWYQRGREIMVYNDATHLHSAPDHIYRESIWRFM